MSEVQKYTYHCHTNFSDGKYSITEMVQRAKELGFQEIGITDHLIVHKNMRQSKSNQINEHMRNETHIYNCDFKKILPNFQQHCDNIRHVSKEEKFKIYVGFEVDYFTYDGWEQEFREFLSQLDYDYLISGNHFLFDESGDDLINLTDLLKIYQDSSVYKDYLQRHFNTMAKAMESGLFTFLAHIDYARRLGDDVCGPEMFWSEKRLVLKVLQKQNKGIEVSTKGLRKIGDYYPSCNILKEISAQNLPVVISDDAHQLAELGYNFAEAEKMLAAIGINNRIKF